MTMNVYVAPEVKYSNKPLFLSCMSRISPRLDGKRAQSNSVFRNQTGRFFGFLDMIHYLVQEGDYFMM